MTELKLTVKRNAVAIAGGALVALALVSCTGAVNQPAPTHSVASSHTPTPGVRLNLNPGGGWSILGDILVKGGYDAVGFAGVTGSIQVFTPESGPLTVNGSSFVPAGTLVSQSWTVAGPANHSYLVGEVEVRMPAHGSISERYVTTMYDIDIRSGSARVLHHFIIATSDCAGSVTDLAGSSGNAVAAQRYEPVAGAACGSNVVIAGWNPQTGKQLWTSDMAETAAALGSIVGETSVGWTADSNGCETLTGLSVPTGRTLWSFDSHAVLVDGSCGNIGIADPVGNAAVYRFRSQLGYSYHVEVDYSDVTADFDAVTGERLKIRQPLQLLDPIKHYGVVYGQDFGAGRTLGIQVYNTVTGTTVYQMDVAKAISLGAQPFGIVNGRLFLSSSDQKLEIDVETGKVISESLGAFPIGVVGRFAYFSNGQLAPLAKVNSYRPAA